ncbi:uncharacterized protein LY89DRAFT_185947 [Mollisia scopiformis]|uniref:Uncharacterized protein n=1 Tax=Mollisia scopiformis TaxID=149040 RepID=A0A194XV32_MOLSC|nr:uncharacterized protein LY89DRAFT_185947 [Mollisia scopiformis]KUJ23567.1 hypothetical protein LY89DRAFT_185947 [Mollisia scopiformis]
MLIDAEGETDFGEGSRQTELAYTNHQNLLPLCWPSIICWGITFVLEVVVYIIVRIFEEKPYEQSTLQPILFIMRSWIILLAFVSLHTFKVMALDARWLCFRAQTVENTDVCFFAFDRSLN